MQARSLVDRIANSEGIFYRAGDEAQNFVSYLTSPYFKKNWGSCGILGIAPDGLGQNRIQSAC